VQRGYSIPSPVLLKCCVASIVAQSIVLYRTCTGQPAVWGFVSLGSTHCDRVFLFLRFTCNTVGSAWWVLSFFRTMAGQLFLQYFDAVGWVSQVTYIVLVKSDVKPCSIQSIEFTVGLYWISTLPNVESGHFSEIWPSLALAKFLARCQYSCSKLGNYG